MVAKLIFSILAATATVNAEPAVDHSAFDALLGRYVHDGMVDYPGLKSQREALAAYVASFADVNAADLSRNERFALFVNAYNACTLLLVVDNLDRGLTSIQDIPESDRWKDVRWKIAGKAYSLDDIEHAVLRAQFGDPRLHTAISCASTGCPKLSPKAFTAATLDKELDTQSREFVNDRTQVYVKDGALHLSSIFKWYAEDFAKDGRTVVDFVRRFADAELLKQIDALGKTPKVEYLPYDWSLNKLTSDPAKEGK